MDFSPSTAELTQTLFTLGAGVVLGSNNILSPAIFDVRAYQGYYMSASFNGSPDNTQDEFVIYLKWFADPLGAVLVYQDEYHAWADAANFVLGAGFTGIAFAPVYVQDRIHGPYMQIQIGNASPNSIQSKNSGVQLIGTTRTLEPYLSTGFNGDEDLIPVNVTGVFRSNYSFTLAASGTAIVPLAPASGRIGFNVINGASQLTVNISYATAGASRIDQRVIAANAVDNWELIWPKRAASIQLVNAATGVNTFKFTATKQNNPV